LAPHLNQKKIIQNGVNIQDGDFTFSHPSERCIFAIFNLKNFKFRDLIENYITTNYTSGFFDKLSISSGIELELGPSRIKFLLSMNVVNIKY
jgi:hypothetical protein